MTRPLKYYLTLLNIVYLLPCIAHGDLDLRINSATELIEEHSDSSDLYLNRAELYYQHEEYKASIEDFIYYFTLNDKNNRAFLGIAKSLFKIEKYHESIEYLDKILASDDKHVLTLRWKAKALLGLKDFKSAALLFEDVIQIVDKSMTDNYLEASNAWLQCTANLRIENAIRVLNEGIENLGPLLVFYNKIVSIYEEEQDYSNAISYQSIIIEQSNRKEFALMKRAELFIQLNLISQASDDLNAAKIAIESLPKSKQNYSAIINLKEKIIKTELHLNRQNEIK